jgi:phosphoheptose isomerase/molybdopterin-guanine dinucleotide biosynthesis protein A
MLDAVILAGGKGTRLAAVVADRPKPMAEVAGRPFLEWLLLMLRAQGVQHVVLSVGHMAGVIRDRFGDGSTLGLDIDYAEEEQALGTAGALRHALGLTRGRHILALNGDSYCRIDVAGLLQSHIANAARATLCVTHVPDSGRYGAVHVDARGAVTGFEEKSPDHGAGWINAGVYLLDRELLAALPAGQVASIERDVFPQIAAVGLRAFHAQGPFIDIGTPESYALAQQVLSAEEHRLRHAQSAWSRARMRARATQHLSDSAAVLARTADACGDALLDMVDMLTGTFRAGGKLLICGNGGSAADAQHLAAEFVSRLTQDFPRAALPALALTTDTSFITAYANDIEFDGIFARQVEAFGRPGDMLLSISTSGNSRNCLLAADSARALGMRTAAMTGAGGALAAVCDCSVQVPSTSTQNVQEATLALYHILVDLTERALYDVPSLTATHTL